MNDRVARLFIERVLQPVDLGCLLLSARCDISGQRTTVGMGRLSSASLASDTRSRSSGVYMVEVPRGCTGIVQAPDLLWFGSLKARWFRLSLRTFTLSEAHSRVEARTLSNKGAAVHASRQHQAASMGNDD